MAEPDHDRPDDDGFRLPYEARWIVNDDDAGGPDAPAATDDNSLSGFLEMMGVDFFGAIEAIDEWKARPRTARRPPGRPARPEENVRRLREAIGREIQGGLTYDAACRRAKRSDPGWANLSVSRIKSLAPKKSLKTAPE